MPESLYDIKLRIEELRKLSQINPSDPWPHFMLGEIYSMINPEEALKEYDEAIRLDPHVVDFHYKKALLLFNQGKVEEALNCLEKASIIDYKNFSTYHYLKGVLLDEKGRYEEAIKEYEKALKKDPDNVWILEAKLLDMIELGLVSEALQEIDRKLNDKNTDETVRLRLMKLRDKIKDLVQKKGRESVET